MGGQRRCAIPCICYLCISSARLIHGKGGRHISEGEIDGEIQGEEKREKTAGQSYKFCQICTKVEKKNKTAKRIGATFVGV